MEDDDQESDIVVQTSEHFTIKDISLTEIEELVRNICMRFNMADANISIALVDDTEISGLNARFLNRNQNTDCLSFDLSNDSNESEGEKSFELVVNAEMAERQAQQRGHSNQAELALYITHSLLHQLGFDDQNSEDAHKMHEMEKGILQQSGYSLMNE